MSNTPGTRTGAQSGHQKLCVFMPVPRLCRSLLSRKTLLPPLTRLFPEGGYPAPCSCVGMHTLRVLHALYLPLSVTQTVSGPSWSCYSYTENRDQHLCRGTLSPSPCTASGEEAECGNSQGHCQAWRSHPCKAALTTAELRIVFPQGLSV